MGRGLRRTAFSMFSRPLKFLRKWFHSESIWMFAQIATAQSSSLLDLIVPDFYRLNSLHGGVTIILLPHAPQSAATS